MERKINQVGIVVKDIPKAAVFYKAMFNVDFQVIDRPKEVCQLHGTASHFQLKTAFGNIAGLQIELIQVLEGRTAHVEFMEQHGEGIHHLAIHVDDIESEIAACVRNGTKLISRGEFLGTKWAYMDTASIAGAVMEFIELPKPRQKKPKNKEPGIQ